MFGTSTPLLKRNRQYVNDNTELIPMITTRRRGSLVKKTLFAENDLAESRNCSRQRPPQRASAAMALTNWKNQMFLDDDAEESTLCSSSENMARKRRNLGKHTKTKTSLYILTLQFLDMLRREGLVNLNKASILLGAKKRRLYDITCVLYAMGCVCKPKKNFVEYRHIDHRIADNNMDFSSMVSFSHHKGEFGGEESAYLSNAVSLSEIDDALYEILRSCSSDYKDDYITVVLSGIDMNNISVTRNEGDIVEIEVVFLNDDPTNTIFWQETSVYYKSNIWHRTQISEIELGFRPIQEYPEEMFSGEHRSRPFTDLYFNGHLETPLASIPMEDNAAYLDNVELSQDLLISLLDDEQRDSSSGEFDTFHCITTPVKSKA
ncbi:transcription factor E2F [Galdieria sulphuraria]|uniref:Transcription factor E2F n=1 Tax=Galdieria sulphuraria TaxID=130081 RepID=M2XTQ7_GALSU|nr:transcription factor E2F [Galdieria sulphuraria]EME26794.1 transcription factor E2F [Galdieria sulphuraria]|eukprot:XP_005703314.1 transcription factor E2F [Galdieria sulphuraria]